MKEKACFPYEFINKENIHNKELPSINEFYSSLKRTVKNNLYPQKPWIMRRLIFYYIAPIYLRL